MYLNCLHGSKTDNNRRKFLFCSYEVVCDVKLQKEAHIFFISIDFLNVIYTFDSIDSAVRAKDTLNGADIYSGCCTLKIDFAKVSE